MGKMWEEICSGIYIQYTQSMKGAKVCMVWQILLLLELDTPGCHNLKNKSTLSFVHDCVRHSHKLMT
jgi:hypothetical protein